MPAALDLHHRHRSESLGSRSYPGDAMRLLLGLRLLAIAGLSRLRLPRTWATIVRFLLPSFVADYVFPEHKPTWRIHPTSYLDGLRGIAALIVFFCHYTEINFGLALTPSYGLNPDNRPSSLVQLPYLRIIFSGRPMVHIFFVISGFALSYKPVKELHARNLDKCYSALASSTFRRPLRLFGPCVVSTFLVLCLRQMGYIIPGEKTLLEEFRSWKEAVFHQITWPWDWDRDLAPNYDIHLWTIPIEFAHSMLLFVVLLMLSRVRLGIRIATVFGLMMYCLTCGKWAGFEFLAGLLLAEIHILKSTRTKALELSDVGRVRNPSGHWLISVLQISLILFGLFIGGWPNENADKTPGIRFFLQHTPMPFATMDALAPQKFWFALSAVAIVWAAGELDGVRKFFEGPFAQYCGRVSYAVYICHGPVGNVFHERLLGHPPLPAHGAPTAANFKPAVPAAGVKGYFGVETPREVIISWFIGLCLVGSLVVWAADVFWRAIDSPIVNLARKLENLCLDDPEPSHQSQGYSLAG